jgi:hypothetical protein
MFFFNDCEDREIPNIFFCRLLRSARPGMVCFDHFYKRRRGKGPS